MTPTPDRPAPESPRPKHFRRVMTPIVVVVAVLYFLIDALFLPVVHRCAEWLGRFRLFAGLAAWIASLGPYQTLALFLVPLIVLEPVKPVAVYLFARGQVTYGALVLVIGEVLKIAIVERLFHIGRDKLMTIAAFAWAYDFVKRRLDYLKALPAWQAVVRLGKRIKRPARRSWLRLRAGIRAMHAERHED